eukprot:TRINITY_DN121375_c0_g1_i1.p2 TRINITY_DN121375_c0_g1~~TRINITY_DN121375_c0_g1_i1.p2  ORF type:complete len:292 (+),score=41.03 TRINITY_DN121375_c0_g1_i1:90-965(+)
MPRDPTHQATNMGRSLSTGALKACAEMKLSHIPKRVTQHGVHLAGFEVLPATLKCGQDRVERQVYTAEAKSHEDTYMENDLPKGSNHARTLNVQTRPEDYKYQRAIKPGEPEEEGGHRGCSHWQSSSKAAYSREAVTGATYHRQHGPSYQALNPPTCVGNGALTTSFREDYGLYGSNPRNRMLLSAAHPQRGESMMPILKSTLTAGTAKGTCHIPGYQGFLPLNTSNPMVARVEDGAMLRSNDKTNLTSEFRTNLVGYAGHTPSNANNDKGGVKPNTISTMGRSFRMPLQM